MSRSVKTALFTAFLGGLAALAITAAGISTSATPGAAPADPCDGNYVGEGLKAVFSNSYFEGGVPYESSIYNDIPDFRYQYYRPDGDCVFHFRNGHFCVGTERLRNNRYVNMRFYGDRKFPTGTVCAPNPYFFNPDVDPTSWPKWFYFRSAGGYAWARNDEGRLILTGTGVSLDILAMTPGQVGYCDTWLHFGIMNDANTLEYDESVDEYWLSGEPVKVSCELTDGGTVRWVIRPIAETYTVRTVTKVKKTVVVNETTHTNALFRTLISNMRSACEHGTFFFPFELIVERL